MRHKIYTAQARFIELQRFWGRFLSKTDNVQIKGYITIPPEGTWLSRICTDHPDWQMKIVSLLPVEPSGGNVLTLWLDNKNGWVERMKHAMRLGAYFNTDRMVEEYAEKSYQLRRRNPWGR
jgi:hypothetical protein